MIFTSPLVNTRLALASSGSQVGKRRSMTGLTQNHCDLWLTYDCPEISRCWDGMLQVLNVQRSALLHAVPAIKFVPFSNLACFKDARFSQIVKVSMYLVLKVFYQSLSRFGRCLMCIVRTNDIR